jgi:hypothetical protein
MMRPCYLLLPEWPSSWSFLASTWSGMAYGMLWTPDSEVFYRIDREAQNHPNKIIGSVSISPINKKTLSAQALSAFLN